MLVFTTYELDEPGDTSSRRHEFIRRGTTGGMNLLLNIVESGARDCREIGPTGGDQHTLPACKLCVDSYILPE